MAKAYSDDLRERVAASVVSGRTCRETAALFGVSVASVVKWSQRLRATGTAAARPRGRKQDRSLKPHRAWLLARLAAERAQTLAFLETVPAEGWQQSGEHPALGPITVLQALRVIGLHERMHLQEIRQRLARRP